MASGFDKKNYMNIFEERYGKGSYDKGISNSYEIGRLKTQASIAEADYKKRMREMEAERKKKEKEAKKEAEKKAKEKEEKGEQKNLFERMFGGDDKDKDKKVQKPVNSNSNLGIPKPDKSYKASPEIKNNSLGKQFKRASDNTAEFLTNAVNTATAGTPEFLLKLMEKFDEKASGEEKSYQLTKPDSKAGQVGSNLLGYATGGGLLASGLRGTKFGARGLDDLLGKKLTKDSAKELAKQTAKEGAVVGGLMAGAEVSLDELTNPTAQDWKDNARKIALETGAGAVLDPLLTLAKPAFKGASEDVVSKILNQNRDRASSSIPDIGEELMPQYDILKELASRGAKDPNAPVERGYRAFADTFVNPRDLGSINRQMSPEELAGRDMISRNRAGEMPERTPEIGMCEFLLN